MTEHVTDELVSLLTGELDRVQTQSVADHLRECDECRAELVEVSVAHGTLSAVRELMAQSTTREAAPDVPALDVPTSSTTAPVRRRRRPALLAVAAAALLFIGGGIVWGAGQLSGSGSSKPPLAGREARFLPVAGDSAPTTAGGTVRMTGPAGRTDMAIQLVGLPALPDGRYYYGWLLDPTTNKMLPLGVIGGDGKAVFELPADIVGRYRAIDVSVQRDNGNPAHSPVSVLRAYYAT